MFPILGLKFCFIEDLNSLFNNESDPFGRIAGPAGIRRGEGKDNGESDPCC